MFLNLTNGEKYIIIILILINFYKLIEINIRLKNIEDKLKKQIEELKKQP